MFGLFLKRCERMSVVGLLLFSLNFFPHVIWIARVVYFVKPSVYMASVPTLKRLQNKVVARVAQTLSNQLHPVAVLFKIAESNLAANVI